MTSEPIVVPLAWPHKSLSPNARVHFMEQHRQKKSARLDAYWSTLYVKPKAWPIPAGKIPVHIIARPAVERGRDDDNLVASLKAAFDGISKALGVDDKWFAAPTVEWLEPVGKLRSGELEIIIGKRG